MSTGWDRTEEFFQLVQLHKPQTTPTTEGASGSRSHQLPTASRRYGAVDFLESSFETPSVEETQFSKDSAALGHELSQASRKIIELQKLAKHRGIFEDRSAEIQALTYDIRQAIITLNSRIDILERSLQSTTEGLHDQVHHRSVVQTLRARLGEVTRDLKNILEQRAKAMKNQEDRRSLYSHSSAAPQFHQSTDPTTGNPNVDLESGGLLGSSRMQTFAPRESAYHSARAEAVETVQKMIGELAQIFNRVATLVTAQDELTVRIEDDMSSALHNLQQGETHLIKYLRSISSNRSLILKVFAVLITFIVFFIIFLA